MEKNKDRKSSVKSRKTQPLLRLVDGNGDPWYTGDFDKTYEDIKEGCEAFLEYLKHQGEIF